MLRLLTALAVALTAVDAAGVCYSPFYSSDYASASVGSLLARDFQAIAYQGFDSVRTYHAQFFGQNVGLAAQAAGLKIAIGIQMDGPNGGEYQYLEQDIQAAIYAAQAAPDNVIAIYAGNENLQNGNFGSKSGDRIVEIVSRVKDALRGTAGAGVPVGTVQRLEEWLHATDAAKVAAACDVVGANIYPFFTFGGAIDMKGTLNRQWSQMTSIYGPKARLTETGWPSAGSSASGNVASLDNAAKYFAAFNDWVPSSGAPTPFYFMMFDVPSAPGLDVEPHFGVATSMRVMKFQTQGQSPSQIVNPAPAFQTPAPTTPAPTPSLKTTDLGFGSIPAMSEAPLVAAAPHTPEPTTPVPTTPEPSTPVPMTLPPTPEPTTVVPTVTPTVAPIVHHGSSSGSHGHGDEIEFPSLPSGSHAGNFGHAGSKAGSKADSGVSVGDGSAGVMPEPTTKSVPTSAPQYTHTPATSAPGGGAALPAATTKSPQAQSELEVKEANAKVARDVSGGNGTVTYAFMGVVGAAGIAAMVIVGVFMNRRNDLADPEAETRTVAASSIDPRGSTPSVYDDPLGTRFSSIVMLTPNGDGVCIL